MTSVTIDKTQKAVLTVTPKDAAEKLATCTEPVFNMDRFDALNCAPDGPHKSATLTPKLTGNLTPVTTNVTATAINRDGTMFSTSFAVTLAVDPDAPGPATHFAGDFVVSPLS